MLEDRTVDVRWNNDTSKRYLSYLLIYTNDSNNHMLDLVQSISMSNVSVDGIKIMNQSDKTTYEVACYVTGLSQLEKLILNLTKNKYVEKVEREIR